MLDEFFSENNAGNKSKILLLLGLAGVFLILLGDFAGTFTSQSKSKAGIKSSGKSKKLKQTLESELEVKVEKILGQIAGVGKVNVKITLASSPKRIYARNTDNSKNETVEKKDSEVVKRSNRHNQESKLVILNKGSGEQAVVRREVKPEIKGILIVAEGARQPRVKADLIKAVERGLGVPSYKVAVLPTER